MILSKFNCICIVLIVNVCLKRSSRAPKQQDCSESQCTVCEKYHMGEDIMLPHSAKNHYVDDRHHASNLKKVFL